MSGKRQCSFSNGMGSCYENPVVIEEDDASLVPTHGTRVYGTPFQEPYLAQPPSYALALSLLDPINLNVEGKVAPTSLPSRQGAVIAPRFSSCAIVDGRLLSVTHTSLLCMPCHKGDPLVPLSSSRGVDPFDMLFQSCSLQSPEGLATGSYGNFSFRVSSSPFFTLLQRSFPCLPYPMGSTPMMCMVPALNHGTQVPYMCNTCKKFVPVELAYHVDVRGRFLYAGGSTQEMREWRMLCNKSGLGSNMAEMSIMVEKVDLKLSSIQAVECKRFMLPSSLGKLKVMDMDFSRCFSVRVQDAGPPEHKQEQSELPELHSEVLLNIFCRLPVRQVFQLRVLSKEWRRVIWCPEFRGLLRLLAPQENLLLEFSFDYEAGHSPTSTRETLASVFLPGVRPRGPGRSCRGDPPMWRHLSFFLPRSMEIAAFGQGLVCATPLPGLDLGAPTVYMCGPLSGTGGWIRKPQDVSEELRMSKIFHVVGLVAQPNSQQYKVYALHSRGPAQVYDSSTGSWTTTHHILPRGGSSPDGQVQRYGKGAVCNGRLYVLSWMQDAGSAYRPRRGHIQGFHQPGLLSRDISEGASWVHQELQELHQPIMPGLELIKAWMCTTLVVDSFGRLLMLTFMPHTFGAAQAQHFDMACIWRVNTETLKLEEVAKLTSDLMEKSELTKFEPVSWFVAADGLLHITLKDAHMQLVCRLHQWVAYPEWWWMPISPPNLLCGGLRRDYAAVPLTPRLDAFIPEQLLRL